MRGIGSAIVIHPYDKTTTFLNPIGNSLISSFPDNFEYLKIETNDKSHISCLNRIQNLPDGSLVVFLGHGRSDMLYGSRGDEFSTSADWEVIGNFPDLYYFKEGFISKRNIDVFAGKRVFCLSCNSKEELAKMAVSNGAQVFLGFGNIPTSLSEFQLSGYPSESHDFIQMALTSLVSIVTKSLLYCLHKDYTFNQLLDVLQFLTSQAVSKCLVDQKDFSFRYSLKNYLSEIRCEIKIFGSGSCKLL